MKPATATQWIAWRSLAAAGALLAGTLAVGPAAGSDCTAWSGEPSPLPRVDSRDPFSAQWALLRSNELARKAELAEDSDPTESHHLWEHLLCIDPSNTAAQLGLTRTETAQRLPPAPPTVSAAPPSRKVTEARAAPKPTAADPSGAAIIDWSEIDARFAVAEELFYDALFRDAMSVLRGLREQLDKHQDLRGGDERRERLEILSAMLLLSLGERAAAHASLARALDKNPALELDPKLTSPKVQRALEAVRSSRTAKN